MEVLHDSLAIQTDLARHLVRNGGKKLHFFYLLDWGGGGGWSRLTEAPGPLPANSTLRKLY